MRKALFLSIFALCTTPTFAAEPAQCDSTAFTLAKPKLAAPKAVTPPAPVKDAEVKPAPKKAKTKVKTSSRLLSTCNDGKKSG